MDTRFDGVGVTAQELQPGTVVMVPVGQVAALVNGGPCIIAWAVVRGPASEAAAEAFTDPAAMWWLDVYMAPGAGPLPQMYRADTILGVPALGLQMEGAPELARPWRGDRPEIQPASRPNPKLGGA